jgi:hypothetical protein
MSVQLMGECLEHLDHLLDRLITHTHMLIIVIFQKSPVPSVFVPRKSRSTRSHNEL